jgi:hypothetical protein
VLDVSGTGFINESGGEILVSDTILYDGASTVLLEKEQVDVKSMTVTVPSTLPAGLYELQVIKNDKKSNKKILAVVPPVAITDVSCSRKKGVLTVTGSGFGEKPAGTDDYINVQINGQKADIAFWSDTQVKAPVSRCQGITAVMVNALIGSAEYGNGNNGKPDKPCKGKKCN